MSKQSRYTAGNYLEVDDLGGGRRVVLVARDGLTYWEAMDVEAVTPIAIHADLHPVDLGTLHEFAHARGLKTALKVLIAHAGEQLDARIDDPLFVGRALWVLAQQGLKGEATPDLTALREALQRAEAQGNVVLATHAKIQQVLAPAQSHG